MNPTTFDMPETIEDEAPASEQDQELQELIDQEYADPGPHPTEPDCNEFGVFVRNVETIEVPMKKAWKTVCLVELGRATDGWWYAGYHFKNGSAAPSLAEGRVRYHSKKLAVLVTLRWMLTSLGWKPNGESSTDQRIGAAIAKFMEAYEVNEIEVVTAGFEAAEAALPKHDPECQEAIEDARAAGLTVGEPVSTQAPVDQAMVAFEKLLNDTLKELGQSVLNRIGLERNLKEAKANEKYWQDRLEKLTTKGAEPMPLFDKKEGDDPQSAAGAKPVEQKPRESDAWKAAPVAELGLPKGLTEKLEGDGITTIGRLEQRRADVANKREKWPKGVGKAAIDKLEDAILKWLADNRDTWQPPAEAPASSSDTPPDVRNTTLPSGIAANDPDAIGDVVARAALLVLEGFEPCEAELPTYESGQAAFKAGHYITDCPYTPGHDQDLWLIGWVDAEKEAEAAEADDEASE